MKSEQVQLKFAELCELQKFDGAEELAVIQLRDECFPEIIGGEREPLEFWRWKLSHKTNNFGSLSWGAWTDDGELVGYYGALPIEYRQRERKLLVGLVCDVMVSPAYQGNGIFTKIGANATSSMLERQFDLLTGFPIRKNVMSGHQRVGWNFSAELPIYISPRLLWWIFSRYKKQVTVSISCPTKLSVIPGFSEFYRKWKIKADSKNWFYHDLNESFLKWRYSAPGVKYVMATIYECNELQGYAICREMKIRRMKVLMLGDMRVLDPKYLRPLISEISKNGSLSCSLVAGMLSPAVSKELRPRKLGFVKLPMKFILIEKHNSENRPIAGNKVIGPDGYLTWSDTDDI